MASPFFILGSGRCGATWMYFVLREHPDIAMTNEARILDFVYFCHELVRVPFSKTKGIPPRESVEIQGIVRDPYLDTASTVFLRHAKAIVEEFYETRFEGRSYKWWGDKLPDPRAGLESRRLWPDARYIGLVRDPRDVLYSWRAFAKREHIARENPHLVDLEAESFARTWEAVYTAIEARLEHPLMLRYEDLRSEPERHVREILAFLDLEWVPEIEKALAENDSFGKHGTSSTPEASMGRWRQELSAEDVRVLEEGCGELMAKFGYEVAK